MERELWPPLYHLLRQVAEDFQQKYVTFQPWLVAAVLLWAALHDRPTRWACDAPNWKTTALRPLNLPSPSTMSRRLRSLAVALFLRELERRLRRQGGPPALLAVLDGKPLPVGGCSKDPDAKLGRGAGRFAKGYKLHTLWAGRPLPEAWEVTPLNRAESVVARELVGRAEQPGGYVVADGNYDDGQLFDAAAAAGAQLLVPLTQPNAGKGHRRQSAARHRCIALMQPPLGRTFGPDLLGLRSRIERSFGNATAFGGGLGPLPAWVRRLHRVRLWVWAKLLINGARIVKNKGLMSSLQ
jgi:DDE family transposase